MKFGVGLRKISFKQAIGSLMIVLYLHNVWWLFYIYIRVFKNSCCTVHISWVVHHRMPLSSSNFYGNQAVKLKVKGVCKILPMFSSFLVWCGKSLVQNFFFIIIYGMGLCEWHRESHNFLLGVLEFVSSSHISGSDLVEIGDWHATSKYFGSLISFFITVKLTSSLYKHVWLTLFTEYCFSVSGKFFFSGCFCLFTYTFKFLSGSWFMYKKVPIFLHGILSFSPLSHFPPLATYSVCFSYFLYWWNLDYPVFLVSICGLFSLFSVSLLIKSDLYSTLGLAWI